MTKHASLEANVLGIKGSSTQRQASLDKFADFEDYRTEQGYLYARIRAISSRVNRNHDGWPSIELAGNQDIFDRHTASEGFTVEASRDNEYGFSTFLGKPIFVDHNNSDPSRARGVIVDAKFHVDDHKTSALDPYYSSPDVDPEHLPPSWVELLLEVDAKQFPKLARAIIAGSQNPKQGIDGFSMGCDVEKSICSICKNSATSPEEFCTHIKLKGMPHQAADGTERNSYENCYGVKFFEISAVFDPADETALLREVRSKTVNAQTIANGAITTEKLAKNTVTMAKLAENPLPQYEQPHAPTSIDTLREEKICPVCGSSMDEETCEVCNYTEPPEPFQNPDLEKAHETDLEMEQGQDEPDQGQAPEQPAEPIVNNGPRNPGPVSHVTGDMSWDVSSNSHVAGRINTTETPLVAGNAPASEEPADKVISDQAKPVTSSVRTASDFIAAAGRNKETTMSDTSRVAAEPIPGAENQSGSTRDHDETRVDVTGVGGVQQSTNEEASKADSQVDVLGKGGTGEEDVKSDKTDTVSKGDEHSKNIEAIPTKTFPDDGQHDPVTNEVFEGNGKSSGWVIQALDAGPYPPDEGELAGGNAVQGTQPADPVGNAEDRVDVLDSTTSPENNSGPTKTWSGTDGNGVTQQQEPVTPESIAQGESGMHNSRVFTAFKLADLEIELGLLSAENKYQRAAELEQIDPTIVTASLEYAQRVRVAAQKKTARLPVLGRNASVPQTPTEPAPEPSIDPDFALGA